MEENGIRFGVDVAGGHKTGFYLDQRDTVRRCAPRPGTQRADVFCYSGASPSTLPAAPRRSQWILSMPWRWHARTWRATADAQRVEWWKTMPSTTCAAYAPRTFDLIVLDPPSSPPHAEARRGQDINLLAFKLLAPAVASPPSCSGGISRELFPNHRCRQRREGRCEIVH